MKENKGKILGVIGGMGPLASQLFYKMVIENTDAKRDQDHIDMIILNHATMPDRTAAIMSGTVDEILDKLTVDAEYLQSGGADFIAIPCNTSHSVIDRLQKRTPLEIINMVESTVEYIKELTSSEADKVKVGILATDGTVKTELYQKACLKAGFKPVVPSYENQKRLMKIIYEGVKDKGDVDYAEFEEIEKEMKKTGCKYIILACTELSCFREMYRLSNHYVDAMEVMAKKAIRLCGKGIK